MAQTADRQGETTASVTCKPLKGAIRMRILEVANEREISPVQFVNERLHPEVSQGRTHASALSYASYHFRELEKAGCLDLIDVVQKRGSVEHVYRGRAKLEFNDEEFEQLSLEQREDLSRVSFQGLIARADRAMQAGTFDARINRHLTWLPLQLDERGWEELTADALAFFERAKQVRDDARDRIAANTEEKVFSATWGLVAFESPPPPPPPSNSGI